MTSATADERLCALAEHLDPDLATRLRELVAADSRADRVLQLEGRAERAEDVLAEIRRQFDPLTRNLDSARAENRELRRRIGIDPWVRVLPTGDPR